MSQATLLQTVRQATEAFDETIAQLQLELRSRQLGTVHSQAEGIIYLEGLAKLRMEEIVRFADGSLGLTLDLGPELAGVALLHQGASVTAGDPVEATGQLLDIPVGEALLGRCIDALGEPIDVLGPIICRQRAPMERPAPSILERAPVRRPLQTGLTIVDAMIPIGRGQRELIIGDRQTGKTAVAIDTILNQREVISIYCSIGQQKAQLARVIDRLRDHGALERCVVIAAAAESTPGLRFVAPYAATAIAEHFMRQGRDVLVIYDDLTQHARAYRELSLLLRRPPGREAFPGDIFYVHSRLLERATQLTEDEGGGSLTALPIFETEAQDMTAYIATNLISITDGQIYLSPHLFQRGHLPAIDATRSVSRVGGKAQRKSYRAVAGELKLAYAQFEELERFTRFGTRIDPSTQKRLEHGRRVREIFRQSQYDPLPVSAQIALLLAVHERLFAPIEIEQVLDRAAALREALPRALPGWCRAIDEGAPLDDVLREQLITFAQPFLLRSSPEAAQEQSDESWPPGGSVDDQREER